VGREGEGGEAVGSEGLVTGFERGGGRGGEWGSWGELEEIEVGGSGGWRGGRSVAG